MSDPDSQPTPGGVGKPNLRDTATRFLQSGVAGDDVAMGQLFQLVYDELRRVAAGHLRSERPGHTLQPTDLVHEAYSRLIDVSQFEFQGRTQFLALASRAMRRVLVDHARGLGRMKRGGGNLRVDLDEVTALTEEDLPDLLEIDRAVSLLAEKSERQAQIVELRFFGGLDMEAVSQTLEISISTVAREWRVARAWLASTLQAGLE